jgi:hypothetical protein
LPAAEILAETKRFAIADGNNYYLLKRMANLIHFSLLEEDRQGGVP